MDKNRIRIERNTRKGYELIARSDDGQIIPGVIKIELVSLPKSLPVLRVDFICFDFLGHKFPEAEENPCS